MSRLLLWALHVLTSGGSLGSYFIARRSAGQATVGQVSNLTVLLEIGDSHERGIPFIVGRTGDRADYADPGGTVSARLADHQDASHH